MSEGLLDIEIKILIRASKQKWLSFADKAWLANAERAAARLLEGRGYLEKFVIPARDGPPLPRGTWVITAAGREFLESRYQ